MKVHRLERVLVIPNFGLGDFLLSFPLLAKIKEAFPRARATVVAAGTQNYRLAGSAGWIDETILVRHLRMVDLEDPQSALYRETIGRAAGESDLVICLVDTPFYREVTRTVGPGKLLFLREEYYRSGERLLQGMGRLLDGYFGWSDAALPLVRLDTGAAARQAVRGWLKERNLAGGRIACLVAKAGDPWKRELKDIPPEAVERLAKACAAAGMSPCLLLPEAEGADVYRSLEGKAGIAVAVFGDLMPVLAFIDAAPLVAGPDTGLLHYAAMSGKRVLSLFGHTAPLFYPTGPQVAVIDKSEGCDSRRRPQPDCARHDSSCIGTVTAGEIAAALRALGLSGAPTSTS